MNINKNFIVILSGIIIFTVCNLTYGLEYTSFVYNTCDLIFFSYDPCTVLEIYESDGNPVYDDLSERVLINDGVALSKGEHFRLTSSFYIESNRVYMVTGSKKFSVLTGDAATSDESSGVCGYYAMDPNGMGVANEFYTYVPNVYNQSFYEAPDVEPEQLKFIVFAYEDNTTVTVQRENPDDPNYYIDLTAPFGLDAGEPYAFVNLSEEYIHVSADKPVSAMTAYDIGYQVPAADGGWAGTEFHTYVSDVHLHGVPFTIDQFMAIAAYEDSQVVIKNTQTQAIVYEGTLQKGQSHVEDFTEDNGGLDTYYTITSTGTISVGVYGSKYHSVFIPEKEGTGIGGWKEQDFYLVKDSDWISDIDYTHILSHTKRTHVDVYDVSTGAIAYSDTLGVGQLSPNIELGVGTWRIESDGYVSVFSGMGDEALSEFAPQAFDVRGGLLKLEKTETFTGDCVAPGDTIAYEIYLENFITDTTDPNYVGNASNLVVVDHLPLGADCSNPSDPNYNAASHTYTWQIASLTVGQSQTLNLSVTVNNQAEPLGIIRNYATLDLESGNEISYKNITNSDVPVCGWGGDVIFVDHNAQGADTGTSWPNAYTNLQSALDRAECGCGDEIWVADGIYRPTVTAGESNMTFQLSDGVKLYGGFRGDEQELSQRNWMKYNTILSGDILGDDDYDQPIGETERNHEDNVDYVVSGYIGVNSGFLDGFVIHGGREAGVFCESSEVEIGHNRICQNMKGIICHETWQPAIVNNWIYLNQDGICLADPNGITVVKNNTIANNQNAGICFDGPSEKSPTITDSIIWSNAQGGDLVDCSASYSCISDGDTGQGNISLDPLFIFSNTDPNNQNYHLKTDSPCIDFGDPSGNYSDQIDIDGDDRLLDGNEDEVLRVDMGADEYSGLICGPSLADFDGDGIVNLEDFAILASAWLSEQGTQNWNLACDLFADEQIDPADLLLFTDDWLLMSCEYMEDYFLLRSSGWNMLFAGSTSTDSTGRSVSADKKAALPPPELTIEELIELLKDIIISVDEMWQTRREELIKEISEKEWFEFIDALNKELERLTEQLN